MHMSGEISSPETSGDMGHQYPAFRHNSMMLTLRVLTACVTMGAVVIGLKATQTVQTSIGPSTTRWLDYPAFEWFVVANSVVLVYAVLAALVDCFLLWMRRGPLSYWATAWLTFLVDLVLANALMSAFSAVLALTWIGEFGQTSASSGAVEEFCDYEQWALIASLCGWISLVSSTIIAASALHHVAPRQV